jgi:hypothetical protein
MSRILFQITEEDIRRMLEPDDCPLEEEDILEIVEAVADMDVSAVIADLVLTYSANKLRAAVEECMSCPYINRCSEGKQNILEGMKALGKKPIVLSGRH